jgi:hypothetical protein
MAYFDGTDEITTDETLDSRTIIARIEYLEDLSVITGAEIFELVELKSVAKTASEYSEEWEYGVTLVRDDYFTEYVREYAIDCGFVLPKSDEWLYTFVTVDWDAAAESLQDDYSSVTFDGVTYWVQ